MGIVGKPFVCNGIDVLPAFVLREIQLYQLRRLERCAGDRVGSAFLDPGENIGEIVNGTCGGADGVGERLKTEGAEVKR